MINTEDFTDWCNNFGITEKEVIDFASGFEIWD
jgi:hypothetical protein